MSAKNKMTGFAIATAAAAVFMIAPTITFADDDSPNRMVSCMGVNSCKGQSACKTATNACKRLNACKGRGETQLDIKSCTEQGGEAQ